MSIENCNILLGDVGIPDPCEIISATGDQHVQCFTVVETFATLKANLKEVKDERETNRGKDLLCIIEKRKVSSIC